jgi:hypothetical protein
MLILNYMGRNLLAFVRPGARRTDAESVARCPEGCSERSKINGPGNTFHGPGEIIVSGGFVYGHEIR